MGDGEDRLSGLSDDILRRILHFVPSKEAASTSVLSRRWVSLWRSCGALNLAVRVIQGNSYDAAFFSRRDAFVDAATAALDAAEAPVTRLTLRVEGGHYAISRFIHPGAVTTLVSHAAARRVEELRVAAVDPSLRRNLLSEGENREVQPPVGAYGVVSLPPSETLRVLDLTMCRELTLGAPAAFPRLATLRLKLCSVHAGDLQALFDAAPELATVHLESVFFKARPVKVNQILQPPPPPPNHLPAAFCLRCPAATALVLELCAVQGHGQRIDGGAMEIDAPRLRSFRYKGVARRFLLRSPALDMARVDVHFLHNGLNKLCRRGRCWHGSDCSEYKHGARARLWKFLHNFTGARDLSLKVEYLKDIAEVRRAELLCAFPNVVRLELEGAHSSKGVTAAVAIANLLRCCPHLRDLRLNLRTDYGGRRAQSTKMFHVPGTGTTFPGRPVTKAQNKGVESMSRLDYARSVDRFMHLRSRPATFKDDNNGGDDEHDEVPADLHGLSGRSFACLQSSLRRVCLRFRLDKPSCLGVRLLKFFADNAMVLEEMRVDTGNRRLHEHMNLGVERWVAPEVEASRACFKRKNLTESSWEFSKFPRLSEDSTTDLTRRTTGFTVLPLQR